jgi:type IV pilus assembly protein PilQ
MLRAVWRAMGLGWLMALGLVVSSEPLFAESAAVPAKSANAETITLDLKGVDILDALKLFSQQTGFNIVAGRNVSGRVTLFVKSLDVWQAFDRLIEANELAYERQGDAVTVMTGMDYELLNGRKFHERRKTQAFRLRSASAITLVTSISQLKSSLGQVMVDEPSNSLIVCDTPEILEQIGPLITQLDVPPTSRAVDLSEEQVTQLRALLKPHLGPTSRQVLLDFEQRRMTISDL